MTKVKDIATALSLFEDAARLHAEATEKGDHRTGNKCYATIAKAITFVQQQQEVPALLAFLDHPSVGVRLWAATYLLPIKEKEGIRTLEQLTHQTGIHSLSAKTILDEWHNGSLKL